MRGVWVVLAACRFGFEPGSGLTTVDAPAGVDSATVGMACTTDLDCGPCERCRDSACETEPIVDVSAGHQNTCFIGAEGSRWCTGYSNGIMDGITFPRRIEGENGWTEIIPGYTQGIGHRNGEVWTWSGFDAPVLESASAWVQVVTEQYDLVKRNAAGDLVINGVQVPGQWADVDDGFYKRCAIDTAGSLFCWGTNHANALGLGVEPDDTVHDTPAQVGTDQDWERVAVGDMLGCAKKTNGTLWCWGAPRATGTNGVDTLGVPTQISADTDWTWLSVHWVSACAGKQDGRIFCWGMGDSHEVIPGIVDDTLVPTEMPGAWDQLVMGGHHYCGRKGTQWSCWGLNSAGQLGVGDNVQHDTPVALCNR